MTAAEGGEGGTAALARQRRAFAALVLVTFIAVLDASIANVALPTIGRDLHASPAATVWVTNAFQLANVAVLFTVGSLGQARGPTIVWQIGIAAFTAGSLLCALSRSFDVLVVARVVQGVGAAGAMVVTPALIRHVYPRTHLGYAYGIIAMVTAVAAAAGPAVGGLVLVVLPWPWLFGINVPLGIAVIALQQGAFPKVPGSGAAIDGPSVATSSVGFSALVTGLDGFARGDAPAWIALQLVAGSVAFAWFIRRQSVLAQPMIDLDLFRLPRFTVAAQCSFIMWAAMAIGMIALPFYLQLDFGVSPLVSGLLMVASPLATAIVAPISGRLSDRYPIGFVATLGLVIFAFSFAFYAYAVLHPNMALILIAGLANGVGFGIFLAPNNYEIMGSGPLEKVGNASTLFAAFRVSGQTLGATLVAIVLASFAPALGAQASPGALHAGVITAFLLAAALGIAGTAVSAQRVFRPGFSPSPL